MTVREGPGVDEEISILSQSFNGEEVKKKVKVPTTTKHQWIERTREIFWKICFC